jgi:hypothetical protein
MSLLQDTRSLCKIPAVSRRKDVDSGDSTTLAKSASHREEVDSEDSTSLAKSIGISSLNIINMYPETFWKKYLKDFKSMLVPLESAVGIMGDCVRDKKKGKSLPWYESLLYFANNSVYFESLVGEFPFEEKFKIIVTVRNELGNSLPIELTESNCHEFFTSLVRETGEEVSNIPETSWRGYVYIKTN